MRVSLPKAVAYIEYGPPGSGNWEATSATRTMMTAVASSATTMAIGLARQREHVVQDRN
jgi:hypothetical protein